MPRLDNSVNLGAQFADLHQFTNWWWRAGQPMRPPEDPFRMAPATQGLVLFRYAQFQVEQITLLAGWEVPAHCHPNVRTYECHIVGTGHAWLWDHATGYQSHGEWRKIPYATKKNRPTKFKRLLIEAGQAHKGVADTVNVVLSFQHWLNGVAPSFIADDWQSAKGKGLWKDGLRAFA